MNLILGAKESPDFILMICHKLIKKGVNKILVMYIYNFLSNRQQRVKIGGDCSSWVDINQGAPQGTVLGPILFEVLIDDCPIRSDERELALTNNQDDDGEIYVDDITIYRTGLKPFK